MRPRRGNIWKLTEKGEANNFVKEMFARYEMEHNIVPAKWILAGYVIEVEDIKENKEV